MIHNPSVMDKSVEEYVGDPHFQEFLNRRFDKTAANAPMDDLVEFAFGDWDAAIEAFEEYPKN
jgi:aminopeptidase N